MFDSIDLIKYLFTKFRFVCSVLIVQLMQSVLYLVEFIYNKLSSASAGTHLLAIVEGVVVEFVLLLVRSIRFVSVFIVCCFGAITFVGFVMAEVLTYFVVIIGFKGLSKLIKAILFPVN